MLLMAILAPTMVSALLALAVPAASRPNGCSLACGFSGSAATFDEFHCMYVKATGAYVCKNSPSCAGNNCSCNKPSVRRLLSAK
jgi:hypothetical protein